MMVPSGSAIGQQGNHIRQEDSGVSLQQGRAEAHASNHRPNVRIQRKPPAGPKSRFPSGNSQRDSAIDNHDLSHHMDDLAIGSSQMASSPGRPHRTGAAAAGPPGWRPPPTTLLNERSHISSIPLPREAAMTPVGNQQPGIASGIRSSLAPDAGGSGRVGTSERGRRNSRSEVSRRGSRSSSASGRSGSRNRLDGGSPHRQVWHTKQDSHGWLDMALLQSYVTVLHE